MTPDEVARKAEVLRRLELAVTRRLDGLLSGDYLGLTAGPGTEPAGARPYGPGDDARRIDWNLTARALAPHVRTTEADRELETWIVADRSASLDFGTARCEKRDLVLAAVASFGFLTVRAGNRFGVVIVGGDRIERVGPTHGRTGLLAALSRVYDTARRPAGTSVGVGEALAALDRVRSPRGQVVVASDFLAFDGWDALTNVGLRHQVVGAHITDPRELELPRVGMLSVVDPESGRLLHVQTASRRLRERYAATAGEHMADVRRQIRGAGGLYLHLSTDRDWLVDVAHFVGRRSRPARRGQPVHPAGTVGR